MDRYFSPTKGFLSARRIAGGVVPADAIAITDDEHDALMAAQAIGKVIFIGPDGHPAAGDQPARTGDVQQALLCRAALDALQRTDVVASRCYKAGVAFPAAWLAYVAALRAIVANPASAAELPAAPLYPEGT